MNSDTRKRHPTSTLARVIARSLLLGALALPAILPSIDALAQDAGRHFQVPAGDLGAALTRFAAESGAVVYFDARITEGLKTPGLNGEYSVDTGLAVLLSSSGLQMAREADGSYRVVAGDETATLPSVLISDNAIESAYGPVDGYIATRSTTGTKTDTPLLEIPQSISVITRDRMTAQGTQSVSESLAYTAGVYSNPDGNNPVDDIIFVRGFQQNSNAAYTDGLRINQVGFFAPETYGMERIEVLKGPASVLYGQGSPGGTVNFVSKRPTFTSHREIGLSAGSEDRSQLSFDIGDILGEQGTLSYRLIALGRDANSSIDYIKDDRVYVAPSLTWNPNETTSITLLASYQRNKGLYTSNMPYSLLDGSNPNGKVPRHRTLNEPSFDAETAEQTSVGYELTHNLSDSWTFKQNLRYTRYVSDQDALHRNSDVINTDTIARQYQMRDYETDSYALDNQMVGKFNTGPLDHILLMGMDYQHNKRGTFIKTGEAPAINIYNPDRRVVIDTSRYTSLSSTLQKNRQLGVYAQDQIKLGKWVASLGGRYDRVNQDTTNRLFDTRQSIDPEDFTGRVGLGYLFEVGLFPYISYTESFTPTSGTSRTGLQFDPETGKQYEMGIKYQPASGDSYVTAAAFDLRRQNVLTADPVNTSYSVQQGEVTSRGVELEALLKPVDGLNMIASYLVNDVEVTKDNPNAAGISNKDNTPVRTPRHLASLWSDYTMQSGPLVGLGFGVGVRYTGSTYGDAQNTLKVPNYTLVDTMIKYDFGQANRSLEGLSATINVKNLTDKYYVAGCFLTAACLLGAERTVIADLTYKW